MKALVGAFNQEKALVGAFSVIVQPAVEPMDRFATLIPEHEPLPVQLLQPVQRLQREDEAGLQREPAPAELQRRVKYF